MTDKVKEVFSMSGDTAIKLGLILATIVASFLVVKTQGNSTEERLVEHKLEDHIYRDRQNQLDKDQDVKITANTESLIERKGELNLILSKMEGFGDQLGAQESIMRSMAVELSRLDGEHSAASKGQ